jgi:hypothetical protein
LPDLEDRVPDIFDEVESDLRAERARRVLQRYGVWFVAAAILIIAGTGGWEYWQYRQKQAREHMASIFLAASNAALPTPGGGVAPDRLKAALDGFDQVIAQGDEGYRTLARLREAALQAQAGKLAAADTLWNQVSADTGADQLLRDLATLQWAQHQPADTPADSIRARVAPLADPTNPWRPVAQEQLALLDLHAGKTDQAVQELKSLANDITAPEGVRTRANALLQRLGGATE